MTHTYYCMEYSTIQLQAERLRVRFPMLSLKFFIDVILWPWVNSASNRNEESSVETWWHTVCWQFASKLSANLHLSLCVQWKTPDDGQRNCPKHVQFYSKNKIEKLVHLVGFIIRICQDSRSPESQKKKITYSECMFVSLVIHYEMRMRRIILSSVLWPALQYSSTLSNKRYDFF